MAEKQLGFQEALEAAISGKYCCTGSKGAFFYDFGSKHPSEALFSHKNSRVRTMHDRPAVRSFER